MFESSQRIGGNLLESGLKPGDKVGIYATNCKDWYLMQFACCLADLVMVTINPAYKTNELEYCLDKTDISAVLTTNAKKPVRILDNLENLTKQSRNKDELDLEKLPKLKKVMVVDLENSKETLENGYQWFDKGFLEKTPSSQTLKKIEENIQNQDHNSGTNIQFTSGTTGLPKGVMLSHRNILNNAYFISNQIEYNYKDILCLPVPFYHCFGMVTGNLVSIVTGCTVLLPSSTFNGEKAMESVERHKATIIYGVPTMFIEFFKSLDQKSRNVSSLKGGIMAGSVCPEFLLQRIENDMGIKGFTVGYGMTETSPVSFIMKPSDSFEKKTKTVGCLLPHLEAKVVDSEGNIVKQGESGELMVKGYSVMMEYFKSPKETQNAVEDSWMRTGDLVAFDEDGYAIVTGRIKDLIIRGGENISPKEIEEKLIKMPNVENIQIIGVPDERYGEEVCALIKLKDPELDFDKKDVKNFLKANTSHYKIPKYVRVVDYLPITVTGKPQKYKMIKNWIEHTKTTDPMVYTIR